MPVIWQNCLSMEEERASDLAELPVPVIWQNCDLAELSVCRQFAIDLAE